MLRYVMLHYAYVSTCERTARWLLGRQAAMADAISEIK